MARVKGGLEAARLATVFICDRAGNHRGQGLLLGLKGEGPIILTCHHVIAPVAADNLYFRMPQTTDGLGEPIPARYDEVHSRPEMDAVVLRADMIRIKNNPLLHALNPATYAGALRAIGLTYLKPNNFDVEVGASTPLEVSATASREFPSPPAGYRIPSAFRLGAASDAREGISGAVVFCEEGVLGLAHFARGESHVTAREVYLVPLSAWAEGWPALANLIKPLEWEKSASNKFAVQNQDLHQLHRPVRDFVGRKSEVSALAKALRGGGIAGISGMGGIGKTELALMVAEKMRAEYSDAQLFADMRSVDAVPFETADVLAEFLRTLGAREERLPEDVDELAKLYRSRLSDKRVLVLLDNVANREQINLLIPPQGCALLITSRDNLSLEGMTNVHLGELQPDEARKLLTSIARRVSRDIADRICSLCGHLPLAIRAASSLLNVTIDLDPHEYAEQLRDERTRIKNIGAEGVNVGVEASFNLSYASLLPEAARVFRQLSVFLNSFDGKSEQVVCDDAGHAHLTNLVRRSLVLYDREAKRYRLHDLMRLFAGKLLEPLEGSMASKRHSAFYSNVLREANNLYMQGGQSLHRGLLLFDTEWSNIEAGRAWAAGQAEMNDEAAVLCSDYPSAGANLLSLRQPSNERIEWLESALAAARRVKNRSEEGAHLNNIGLAYGDLGENQKSIEYFEEALTVAREAGGRHWFGSLLGELGHAYLALGQPRRALEYYNQWLDIARSLDYRQDQTRALHALGDACADLSETDRAIEFYQQALTIARELGNPRDVNVTLSSLGDVYADLGEMNRAIEFYGQALSNAREVGDPNSEAQMLNDLGDLYLDMGEVRRALELYEQRIVIARDIRDRADECEALIDLGNAHCSLGKVDEAIEFYEQSLTLARQIKDRQSESKALSRLGSAYVELDEPRRAIEFYEQDLAITRELGDKRSESSSLNDLGSAYAALREMERAVEFYEQSLSLAREIEDQRREGHVLGNLGNAYADMNDMSRSIELLEQSAILARKISDREGECHTLQDLGAVYADLGQTSKALEYHQRALSLARELCDLRSQAHASFDISLALKELGEQARAINYAESALELYLRIEDPQIDEVHEHLRQLREGL